MKALSPDFESSMYFQSGINDQEGETRGVSDLFAEVINDEPS